MVLLHFSQLPKKSFSKCSNSSLIVCLLFDKPGLYAINLLACFDCSGRVLPFSAVMPRRFIAYFAVNAHFDGGLLDQASDLYNCVHRINGRLCCANTLLAVSTDISRIRLISCIDDGILCALRFLLDHSNGVLRFGSNAKVLLGPIGRRSSSD